MEPMVLASYSRKSFVTSDIMDPPADFRDPGGRDTPRMRERWMFGLQTCSVQRSNYTSLKLGIWWWR
jgi:hypothetical protein